MPSEKGLAEFLLERPARLLTGLPYAAALMGFLLFHEMGHYLACRRHGIAATLPYFIPFPTALFGMLSFGTLGAVIRIREPIPSRSALFDIGIAGPLAGFIFALPVTVIGIALSRLETAVTAGGMLQMGEPLLFKLIYAALFGSPASGTTVVVHPVAIAGWFGMLATSLNLLPVGQLDGGHITYSLFRRGSAWISRISVLLLVALGIFVWRGWLAWGLLVTLIGWRHPPVLFYNRLKTRQKVLAAAALLILVLSFIPAPLTLAP
jgi:membrane-associated protease RseP (regulator of RpoE activity)